ncbi:hypothetical protein G7Z17_g3626 [Cylindrodendrum hubeiense]|uniref:EF-hand domain-containing protein n=1 Tax=Cylindrodendrum hubeiense TaxID=595255 RepID=A0A9P5HAI2_9HYPO|nr:hypothetical protein G7Z17_g3626 [Cylindrodendrum hubeiense]
MLDENDSLEVSEQQMTIAAAAQLCLGGFQECLHLSSPLHPRDCSLVEDQIARFSSWTSSIGVFSRGRASMDHRLREAPEVRDAVIDLLETLGDSIQDASSVLQEMASSQSGKPDIALAGTNVAGSPQEKLKGVAIAPIEDLECSPAKTISKPKIEFPQSQQQITTSTELPNQPAETSTNIDFGKGKSTVQSVVFSATTLAAGDYKKASTPSVISATKTVALDVHEELSFPPSPNGRIRKKYKALLKLRDKDNLKLQAFLDGKYAGNISELNLEPSIQTLDEVWHSCNVAIAEVICPFCLYALPGLSVDNEKKWKAHLTNDLDAYVCLFDDCDKPEALYNHSSDWLDHMHAHTLRWRCNSKSHGSLVFPLKEQYLDHMRQAHTASFTEPQLRVLAERNGRPIGPMFDFCPICGTDEVTTSLKEHIVGHLRLLALKSLPAYEDEGSECSGGGGSSAGASKPASRTTIKNDPQRYTRPIFQDISAISTQRSLDPSSMFSGQYDAWGGYKNFVAGGDELFPMLESPENDAIIQSMLQQAFEKVNQNMEPSSQLELDASVSNSPPKHGTSFCELCDDHPEGFRGNYELRRHIETKHANLTNACAHSFRMIKSNSPLTEWVCQDCGSEPHWAIWECTYCKFHVCPMCVLAPTMDENSAVEELKDVLAGVPATKSDISDPDEKTTDSSVASSKPKSTSARENEVLRTPIPERPSMIAPSESSINPALRPLFDALDMDGTGHLSEPQLSAGFSNKDFNSIDPNVVHVLVQIFDADRSGTIDFADFCAMWSFLASWRTLFKRFNSDQSGNINTSDFNKALVDFGYRLSPTFVDLVFEIFDTRGEGFLSFDAFLHSCISLKRMTDEFKKYDEDRDGYITFSFEEFLCASLAIMK